jgi:hypothetical protein
LFSDNKEKGHESIICFDSSPFAALLIASCNNGTEDNNTGGTNTGGNNTDNTITGGATMTWSGSWTRVSDTTYKSDLNEDSANTIQRLDITASKSGTVTIQIKASGYGYDDDYRLYGYASKLDTGVSTSAYQMQVSGTEVAVHTYSIPSGSHWIQFMYKAKYYDSSSSVTVEIISSSFTSPNTNTNAKLKVQNQSSVTLSDVKWSNTVVSASLIPPESKTVDVTEGSSYLYFTKGSASGGLKCRTRDVIAVSKDETKEFTFTDNTLVVAMDDTNNPQALGTIGALPSTAVFWDDAEGEMQPFYYTE